MAKANEASLTFRYQQQQVVDAVEIFTDRPTVESAADLSSKIRALHVAAAAMAADAEIIIAGSEACAQLSSLVRLVSQYVPDWQPRAMK